MFAIIGRIFSTLISKKGRTILTLSGIAVGVASVIVINNIGQCGDAAFTDETNNLGMSGIAVSLKNDKGALTTRELEIINSVPSVDNAVPLIFEASDAELRDEKTSVYMWGINSEAKDVISLELIRGRFFNSGDISSGSKVCLIDEAFAKRRFGTINATGRSLRLRSGGADGTYTVKGIIKTGSGLLQNMMGSYLPDFIYVPYTTMQNYLGSSNFTQIIVKLRDGCDNDLIGKRIIKRMEKENGSSGTYSFMNLAQQKENISSMIRIFTAVLSSIGMVSLFVAGLSIMNVMIVAVHERTREIGIKKALGAKRSVIIAEFLCESVILSLTGGVIGVIIGTAASVAGVELLGLTFIFRADIIFGTLAFAAVTGVLFGIYPAVRASGLRPSDALRTF